MAGTLEALGLIYAPHTSAGRMPTEAGLRLFVDGLLEIGDLTDSEQAHIEAQIAAERKHRNIEEVLTEAGYTEETVLELISAGVLWQEDTG